MLDSFAQSPLLRWVLAVLVLVLVAVAVTMCCVLVRLLVPPPCVCACACRPLCVRVCVRCRQHLLVGVRAVKKFWQRVSERLEEAARAVAYLEKEYPSGDGFGGTNLLALIMAVVQSAGLD